MRVTFIMETDKGDNRLYSTYWSPSSVRLCYRVDVSLRILFSERFVNLFLLRYFISVIRVV